MLQLGDIVWQPDPSRARESRMGRWLTRLSKKEGFDPAWPAFHRWSIENRGKFWAEVLKDAEVAFDGNPQLPFHGEGMLGTTWFPHIRLNYAEHLLRHDGDRTAMIAEDETGRVRRLSRRELRQEVVRCRAALQQAGVGLGDRVAGFIPNTPEAIIAMLATASLGAIWSSCSPDFGLKGVLDRFGQIEPKVLFAADGYRYNGKEIDCLERIAGIAAQLPMLAKVVVFRFLRNDAPDLSAIPKAESWMDFQNSATVADAKSATAALTFERVPFNHPLFIMYSSGTTGVPKCILHGHGGTLLQHMKELMLHCDLRPEEVIFYFTTCGWMMWNWVVSSLGVGATLALYEGCPTWPEPSRLFRFAEEHGLTLFGTSPKFLSACQKAEIEPGREFELSKLRLMLSTGSPLAVENYEWVHGHVKQDLPLASISGGTDIISCFMLGNPLLPVRAGEIQGPGLGMDIHAFDENARPVIGTKGELVCTTPFPSQPVGFWNDPDGRKYRSAYFDVYEGVWRHGDFIEITPNGGIVVYGRSDATLNPGGVRIGTAEIYRIVETLPEIQDSLVIGRPVEDDVEVCLFVLLRPGFALERELEARIRQTIVENATRRHVPRHIRSVTAIPYTISGKKVELAVTRILAGETVKNRDALANPDALDQYAGILD